MVGSQVNTPQFNWWIGRLREATKKLSAYIGGGAARALYDEESIVAKQDFNLVWWDGVGKTMHKYPQMFHNWVTKQTSGCCGSNHELAKWDATVIDTCPNCHAIPEMSKHMTVCTHNRRQELFLQSVASILDCVSDAQSDPVLLDILDEYLSAQGSKSMSHYIHHPHSPCGLLVDVQDCLGWENFVGGWIFTLWLEVMAPCVYQAGRISIIKWGCQFVDSLLSLTHKQ